MNAVPKRVHQKVSGKVLNKFFTYLEGNKCDVYVAPFDVRLPVKSNKNEDSYSVVQADICVICDKSNLDDASCIGAPDLIVEIMSPRNNQKELKDKYEVYEESGVKEYLIIHPTEQTLLIYNPNKWKICPIKAIHQR